METELIRFIQHEVVDGDREIAADTALFSSKLLDSMNVLDLIGFVEARLDRKLSDDEFVMSNFATPRRIIEVFFS